MSAVCCQLFLCGVKSYQLLTSCDDKSSQVKSRQHKTSQVLLLDGSHGLRTGLAVALEALHVVQVEVAHVPVPPVGGQLAEAVRRAAGGGGGGGGVCFV
jgi:hypothetical protein